MPFHLIPELNLERLERQSNHFLEISIGQPKTIMIKKPDNIKKAKALFFAAAGISFLLSVFLWFTGHKEQGLYVGIWVPSICSAGSLVLAGGRNG